MGRARKSPVVDTAVLVESIKESQDETTNVVDILLQMCKDIDGLCRADMLESVRSIPIRFTGFNRASQIGGFPLSCIHITHGPQHAGKSLLEMVKCISATERGHIAVWVDVEQVFDKKFYTLLGGDLSKLIYKRTSTYEETIEEIDVIFKQFRVMKDKELVPEDTCLFIVVDSLTKLMPKKLMKEVLKAGEQNDVDKQFRMLGMTKAMFNQGWFDHLTPIVGRRDVGISFIVQERTNKIEMGGGFSRGPQKVEFQDKNDFKLKGGAALLYDNSLQCRVTVDKEIWDDKLKEKVGKIHNVHIAKNKVGYPNEEFKFYFYKKVGNYTLGIDYERTLLEDLDTRGWIHTAGAWKSVHLDGDLDSDAIVRAQGMDNLTQALKDDSDVFQQIILALDGR